MKRALWLFLAVTLGCLMALLMGCHNTMPNDKIIDETRYCEAAGLRAVPITSCSGVIVGIQCAPYKKGDK